MGKILLLMHFKSERGWYHNFYNDDEQFNKLGLPYVHEKSNNGEIDFVCISEVIVEASMKAELKVKLSAK